jgi:quercetin dioxygenase-like cupin family protein
MKKFILIYILLFAFGCQSNKLNRLVTPEKTVPFPIVAVPEGKNLTVFNILNFQNCSFHRIILKTEEISHIHEKHDLAVYVLNGSSWIYLNDKKVELFPGDFIVIPKGVKHYAVNVGKNPAEVLAIFSPSFDGKDIVPVSKDTSK